MAASSRRSRRSVIPVTAECTMSTRAPAARRARTMPAMFIQLARLDTLVPPNLRTIQAEGGVKVFVSPGAALSLKRAGSGNRRASASRGHSGQRTVHGRVLELVVEI